MRRTDQRRAAVFAVYQHDVTGRSPELTLPPDARPFTRELAAATLERRDELDELIARHARGWTLDRIAPLERGILRVALLELLHPDRVAGARPIPPEAAIDEAVETAKAFCGADAPGFVNGILGAALDELREQGRVEGSGSAAGAPGDGAASGSAAAGQSGGPAGDVEEARTS